MRTIIVEPYNPEWPVEFDRIKEYLLPYISDLIVDIVHVGSTSVPGLASKPIIDFNIIIESYDVFPKITERLKDLGYEHEGNLGVEQREAFRRVYQDEFMKYHMYICPKDSTEHKRQLAFRDYLRKLPKAADDYGKLKQNLAKQFPHDIDAYIDGKHEFVESIIRKAKEKSYYEQN